MRHYKVELWPLDKPKPYANNPRNNDAAVSAVAKSIAEFGFRQPIIVDAKGVVIAGHTRLKAAVKLGLKTVPVHVASDLTPKQARALRIADNKTAELAEWESSALAAELVALPDVPWLELGFADKELEALMGNGNEPKPVDVRGVYEVIVECDGEEQQRRVYDDLIAEGMKCRVLTL